MYSLITADILFIKFTVGVKPGGFESFLIAFYMSHTH